MRPPVEHIALQTPHAQPSLSDHYEEGIKSFQLVQAFGLVTWTGLNMSPSIRGITQGGGASRARKHGIRYSRHWGGQASAVNLEKKIELEVAKLHGSNDEMASADAAGHVSCRGAILLSAMLQASRSASRSWTTWAGS